MFASPCAEWDREQSVLSLNRDGPCNSAAAVVLHSMLIALLAWTAGAYALTPEHRPDSGSRNKEETGVVERCHAVDSTPGVECIAGGCGAGAGGRGGLVRCLCVSGAGPCQPTHHTAIVRMFLVRRVWPHNELW